MDTNKKNKQHQPDSTENLGEVQNDPEMNLEEATTADTEVNDVVDDDSQESEEASLLKKYQETQAELDKQKKEYLFLMADFDNYRKRVVKEKAEIIKNAAERVLKELLPIVDDFERALDATKADTDGQQVREGMELIYNKLVKYLESNGVKAIESTGKDFDDNYHDAITTIPAPDESMKGKVVDTTTKGYTINDKVLRHAKVVVGK